MAIPITFSYRFEETIMASVTIFGAYFKNQKAAASFFCVKESTMSCWLTKVNRFPPYVKAMAHMRLDIEKLSSEIRQEKLLRIAKKAGMSTEELIKAVTGDDG
jgi:hypothetical protein